jgi:lysophospholipase L1-like esterase
MKTITRIIALLPVLLALALAGCSLDAPSDPTGDLNPPGPADAMNQYVAIGNSLSAGFMDSGLMKAGQANSFPMIVATQMGVADFTQPWIEFPGIGTTNVGAGNISGVLYYNGSAVQPVAVTPQAELSSLLLAVAQPTQYNNLSVPGAFSYDQLTAHSASTSFAAGPPFSRPNSYFEFINRSGADTPQLNLFANLDVPAAPPVPGYQTGSQFYQAVAQGPAMVTAWIGGNDFLFGATSGDPQGPANALITPAATFATNYGTFMNTLAAALVGRNGFPPTIITATLPQVRNIPYFLDRLSFEAVFGGDYTYEEADAQYILFTNFLASDLVTDPTGTMPTNLTLSTAEVSYLDNQVIGAYNGAIQTVVDQLNNNPQVPATAAFVDVNVGLDALRISNPDALRHFLFLRITSPGESIAETAARPYWGLDGVHPNNKGYAYVANEFLKVINATLDTDYAEVPVDAFVWDPTYGQPIPTKNLASGIPTISPEVAEAMRTSFR